MVTNKPGFSLMLFVAVAFLHPTFNYCHASDTTRITVDFQQELGQLRRSELYNNNSLLRTPSNAVVQKLKKEVGVAKIMRCWVTVEDFWNYQTDEYNFNFPCGWDLNTWDRFYDYMERFSEISEAIVLNVRGAHGAVVTDEITMRQWKEAVKKGIKHYKERYPKIKYIEALNEYAHPGFGGLTDDQYYSFYQVFYQMVNEINEELKPKMPLLVGGPCITGTSFIDGSKRDKMKAFLKGFAEDHAPDKKLDFISYHEYREGANPSTVAVHEQLIDKWCAEVGLPTNIPIQVNEMGAFGGKRKSGCVETDQQVQAAAMNSLFYFYNQQPDLQAFHWVIQHKTNDRKTQIYDNHRWSTYGLSLKMQAKMAETQVEAKAPPLKNGKGVYTLASKGDRKVVIQVWNYQWTDGNQSHLVKLHLKNLPGSFKGKRIKVNEYLLDSKNNNLHSGYGLFTKYGEDQLEVTHESIVDYRDTVALEIHLEPNAISLIEILPQ